MKRTRNGVPSHHPIFTAKKIRMSFSSILAENVTLFTGFDKRLERSLKENPFRPPAIRDQLLYLRELARINADCELGRCYFRPRAGGSSDKACFFSDGFQKVSRWALTALGRLRQSGQVNSPLPFVNAGKEVFVGNTVTLHLQRPPSDT
jgi:anti-sigma factor RsiW